MFKDMIDQRDTKLTKFNRNGRRSDYLEGKVVLLVGNDSKASLNLIAKLAEKGAHIAFVCQKLSAKSAQFIRRQVENFGSHFLLLEDGAYKPLTVETVIDTVSSQLGNLDIFLDMSSEESALFEEEEEQSYLSESHPNWMLTKAILAEFAQS